MDVTRQTSHPFNFLYRTFKVIFLGLVVLSLFVICNQIPFSEYFLIKKVRVYGLANLEQAEIKETLLPLVNQGFFAVDVDHIRERLMQFTWVSDLYVRRVWPDEIDITILEKDPVAIWNDSSLLSQSGELFNVDPKKYPQALPQLSGPTGKQVYMLAFLTEMNRLLRPLHVKISYLELTPYLAWKVTLNNGLKLQVGHKDILTRLGHFVKVYPKIVKDRAEDVDYIDLRYPNGMAVRWRDAIKT